MSSLIWLWNMGCGPSADEVIETSTSCWQEGENTWDAQIPPEDLEGTGFGIGETPPDMCMKDQFGNNVSLWQFYDQLILLDVTSEWSGSSQIRASGVEQIWTDYKSQNFIYLTLLTEDVLFAPPSVETLEQWAENFSAKAPMSSS